MPLPRLLLQNIAWSFAEALEDRPADMVKAVAEYADDLALKDPTARLVASLPFADVTIAYSYFERLGTEWAEVQREVRIVGADGNLSGADLLWEPARALRGDGWRLRQALLRRT